VSLTKAPVSAAATTVTGLAAFAAVAVDAGWQFVRLGTVMAHEGAHAVPVRWRRRRRQNARHARERPACRA
jgi:hypothetical protein